MSVPVELDALRDRIAEYGDHPFLVTVNDDGTAHVTSVSVRVDGDDLVCGAGRRTRANVAERPGVSLLWPTGPDPAYSLIVDAAAVVDEGSEDARLTPHSAILHRVAGAAGDGPTCLPVSEPPAGDP